MTRVIVLADTHVRAGAKRRLPAALYAALESADVILHAGDLVSEDLFHELWEFAPTHAVLGNNDDGLDNILPRRRLLDLDGVRIGMVHDSGARVGREARLRRWFPDAHVVVFGHSHIPLNVEGIEGQRLFNPGSPTQRRAQPHHTMGIFDLEAGRAVRLEVVTVDRG